jgi:hypothetical protein
MGNISKRLQRRLAMNIRNLPTKVGKGPQELFCLQCKTPKGINNALPVWIKTRQAKTARCYV